MRIRRTVCRAACQAGKGLVAAVLVAAPIMALSASPVSAATTASVADAAQLKTAWEDETITQITLTADIQLGNSSSTCFIGAPFRDVGGTGIVVDGQGLFGITSTCDFGRLLTDFGTESVTLTGLTHFDDGITCGAGGGLYAEGPVTVVNTSASDNVALGETCPLSAGEATPHAAVETNALGGGVYSGSDVNLTGATFTGNHADLAGGAVAANGEATITGSTFTGNSAGSVDGCGSTGCFGGAVDAGITMVTGSTFTGNFIGAPNGDLCGQCFLGGGAIVSEGITASGSAFTDNHADCAGLCNNFGGAFYDEGATVDSSTFTGNSATCGGECENVGGAVASLSSAQFTSSTLSGNKATCADACQAEGGAVFVGDIIADGASTYGPTSTGAATGPFGVGARAPVGPSVSITSSQLHGNTATCTDGDNCGGDGGAVYAQAPTSVEVTSSTFDGNVAKYFGGALSVGDVVQTSDVSFTNSTVTGNSSGLGGAIDASDSGTSLTLAYDTIVANVWVPVADSGTSTANADKIGAAVAQEAANLSVGATFTSFGTIVALPQGGGTNCFINTDKSGVIVSQGYNWSDDTSCGFTNTTDKVATPNDPGLNALGAWGGPTPTMLPLTPKFGGAASPVIDAIPTAACRTGVAADVTTDQRGVTRPQLLGCDIGAVEVTLADYQVEAAQVIQPRFTG